MVMAVAVNLQRQRRCFNGGSGKISMVMAAAVTVNLQR
jgi:hypothetical protein